MKNAYFAAGCFWCITPSFYEIPGVSSVIAGYSGGQEQNPSYLQVKSQQTTHRETICIVYDENVVTYEKLLRVFLSHVDPFDGGGQFIDRGQSYTLAVYYTDDAEKEITQRLLAVLEQRVGKKCAVSIEPFLAFWNAEEEHQDYYRKHPDAFRKEMEESGRSGRVSYGSE